ncbi:hypothetical protein AB5I41_20470 [Sphingomonas sp. MMS24-JH45]
MKSGRSKMAARAATDGTSALLMAPAHAVRRRAGGRGASSASAAIHGVYCRAGEGL